MKKTIKLASMVLIFIIFVFVLYWGVSIIKCEYLTHKYAQEYERIVLDGCEPVRLHKIKVLDCKDSYIRVYYELDYYGTTKPGYGFVAEIKDGERMNPELADKCIWSNYGSADGYIWPYGR